MHAAGLAARILVVATAMLAVTAPTRAQCPAAPVITLNVNPCSGGSGGPGSPQIVVDWAAIPGATSYEVYRSTGGAVPTTLIGTATSPPTFKDFTPPVGQAVSYRVRAVATVSPACPGGTGAYSNTASLASPIQPPAGPMSGLSLASTCSGVTVTWDAAPQAANYLVRTLIDGVQQGSVQTTAATSINVATTSSAQVVTVFAYMIDGCSRVGPESSVSGSSSAPLPAPGSPVVVSSTCAGVTVSWSPVAGAVRYRVRVPRPIGDVITSVTAPTFTYVPTNGGPESVSILITPEDACGGPGAQLVITASVPLLPPPVSVASTQGAGGALVVWPANANAAGYVIERRDGSTFVFQVTVQGTSYFDPVPAAAQGSTYFVWSMDTCGLRSTFPASSSIGVPASFTVIGPPQSQRRLPRGTANFRVDTAGAAPAIQWRRNGVNLTNADRVSGATSPALTITDLRVADSDLYDVVLSRPGERAVTIPFSLVVVNPCPPDFDESGERNVADIFAYLSSWFAGCP